MAQSMTHSETMQPATAFGLDAGRDEALAADRDEALAAGRDLEGAAPQEILRWALERFHPRLAIASSMAEAVLIDMATRIQPGVPVVFLDTGYHFAETIGTRDAVAAVYPVELINVTPVRTPAEQDAQHGPRLYERDPNRCCALRKVEPLERALAPYLAWASGIRRDESATRRDVRVVDWDARRGKVKVNPLAAWTADDVDRYVAEHGVLVNPLLADGYASVGCAPCTRRVEPGADPRSGRWAGAAKTECGLHL
jgi:phosphoadenosine phosphosulfate reductase